MNGANDDRQSQSGKSVREIISDATDRELRDFTTGSLTPEELTAMAAAEERRRKRRMRRINGIAALFVIVLACGAFFVFSTFTADVDADKNPKEEIVTEDGVIIEDGGWGSSSEDTWEITDWSEVSVMKATIPELVIPEYIPEGYEFERLTIESIGSIIDVDYLFVKTESKQIVLQQKIQTEKIEMTQVYDYDKCIKSSKGDIYVLDGSDSEINNAIMQMDDGIIIYIWYSVNAYEIKKVVESLN